MLGELTKTKHRKKGDGYDDLYGRLTVAENEKPLLMRRISRVIRGFDEEDLKKNVFLNGNMDKYDWNTMIFNIMSVLELQQEKLVPDNVGDIGVGYRDLKNGTFDRIMSQNNVFCDMEMTELTVRALNFLTAITLSLLDGRVPDEKTDISCEITDGKIIAYLKPEIPIDKKIHPNIKSVILSRSVGAELEVINGADGELCYKLTVSMNGEFLYEVRRTPEELSDCDGEEACEIGTVD